MKLFLQAVWSLLPRTWRGVGLCVLAWALGACFYRYPQVAFGVVGGVALVVCVLYRMVQIKEKSNKGEGK